MLSLILAFSIFAHHGSTEYHPQNNLTDCLNAINSLPDPLDPGSGLPKDGDYVAPIQGMTILGDSCMIFCGVAPDLNPAIRPISSPSTTTLVTTTTPIITVSMQRSSTTSEERPRKALQTSTTLITMEPGPSQTKWMAGGATPSTWWVIGGAQPTTVTTEPASQATPTDPSKEADTPLTAVTKRQQVPPPTIPSKDAAVKLEPGACLTLCPNAILHSRIPSTSTGASTVPTVVVGLAKDEGRRKLTPAFIILGIVLPVLTTIAALVAGAMMLKYRRRCKVLSNERNRNIEMPEG